MNISLYNLSKEQTTILKGVGILVIVLHNFIHITNHIGENEFDFNPERIMWLLAAIKHNYLMIINGSLSYFGFLGIEIFIFISGYGLVKQFLLKRPASYRKYIIPKLVKIYGLIFVGIVFFAILLFPIHETSVKEFISVIKSVFLLYNNFSFDTLFRYAHIIPWWFFSFIVQLYIIFPLLFHVFEKYKEKGFIGLLILSYLLIYGLQPIADYYNFPIYANFIGHLPEFLIGMGFAFFKEFRLNYKIILGCFCIFILSNFLEVVFPLLFASATILILFLCYPIYNKPSMLIKKPLLFIGGISMFMFVINSLLRVYFIDLVFGINQLNILLWTIVHLCLTILISYIISVVYNRLINPQLNRLTKAMTQ